MKLIITADDYGMCEAVDRGIDECIAAGLCTSTNVIVNMDDFDAAKSLRSRFPNVSIGIHWNITSGKPISSPAEIATLVDSNGRFYKASEFIKRYHKGFIKDEDIVRELKNQYQVFQKACGKADYWNTHQNSALDFKIFRIFCQTALALGINKTRTFRRIYHKHKCIPGGISATAKEWCKKIILDIWFGYFIARGGVQMTDGRVIYFDDSQKSKSLRNICEDIDWGNKKSAELVIHPATVAHHPYFGSITDARVAELKMFTSAQTKQHLESHGIEIINFELLD